MTTVTASVARQQFAELLNRVAYGGERIAIARRGKVLGALVSAADLAVLERMDARARLRAAARAGKDSTGHGGRTPGQSKRGARPR